MFNLSYEDNKNDQKSNQNHENFENKPPIWRDAIQVLQ